MLKKIAVEEVREASYLACVAEAMVLWDMKYLHEPFNVAGKLYEKSIGISNEFKRENRTKRRTASRRPKAV